ncbi:MAG: ARMT1-like domain-containing protein [bacterium]
MKMYLECLACVMNQALRAGRIATDNEETIRELINDTGMMIKDIPMDASPPEIGELVYRKINRIVENNDPYKNLKKRNIERALKLYPEFKQLVNQSGNPLLTAVKLAVAGNIIDFGVNKTFDIERDIRGILEQEFAIFDFEQFTDRLNRVDEILYIGDNAGEGVFDRILIEEMDKPVKFAVRSIPIINDITMDETGIIGLDSIAEIIDSGVKSPGLILKNASRDFRELFSNADMIISKGQGNYEGLSEETGNIFFLLKAKCHVIARDIGVNEGDIIIKSGSPGSE